MAVTLYYAPNTRAGRVRWLLEELAVPYALERVALHSPQSDGPGYRAIHPLGKVPAAVIDGRAVFETGALLLHLAERLGADTLDVPTDHPERGAYLQWVFYAATTLEPPVVDAYDRRADPAAVASARAAFVAAARPVEATLAGREFLVAGRLTAADVAVASVVGWARALGMADDLPALVAYGKRLAARPAARAARAD